MIHYLDTDAVLIEFCTHIKSSPWLALDTEFMRQSTYYAELCLIQVATPEAIACIDVLTIKNLAPLLKILFNPKQLKIVHSGDQDLEVIHDLTGEIPNPVFDTQIAGAMLGFGEQISYAALVKNLCSIELDKAQTRTNWAQRPLDTAQLHYAADDVRYLCDLYQQLERLLHEKSRYDWVQEESAKLTSPSRYDVSPEQAWTKLKGLNHLQQNDLIIAQALADWRERYAINRNKPRKWILADASIIEMCLQKPQSLIELSAIKDLSPSLVKHHGEVLLTHIDKALQQPKSAWPTAKLRHLLTASQKKQFRKLKAWLLEKSESLKIAAPLLATSKDLEQLVSGDHNTPLLSGWRYDIAGKEAILLLQESRE